MSRRIIGGVVPCVVLCAWASAFAQGAGRGGGPPQTTSKLPENPQSLALIDSARKMTNGDAFLTVPFNFFCSPYEFNKRQPDLEPMKVFDNLYEIPSSNQQQTTIWAITTREGIILIDSGQQGRQDAILAGMRAVGLDPANVKYILLGHGHGDHFANAAYFQEQYGTKVGAAAKDWDVMFPANPPAGRGGNPGGRGGNPANAVRPPKKDVVLSEGMPVKLGETTVTVVEIPGHTPGSLAFIFDVADNGQKHVAGIFGGTIMAMGGITPAGLKQYTQSVSHYLDIAKQMNVDVLIQNHAVFDDTPNRLDKLKARQPGEPHPFMIATSDYVTYWNIISTCIQAELARRGPAAAAN